MASILNHCSNQNPIKTRLRGSCDICKRRKVKCDRTQRQDGHCSSCSSIGVECIRTEVPVKDREPGKYARRVTELESKVKELQDELDRCRVAQNLETMADSLPTSYADDVAATDEELVNTVQDLNLGGHSKRYFGSSSGLSFMGIGTGTPQDLDTPIAARTRPIWEENPAPMFQYSFPEDDLLQHLIDLYFSIPPVYLPILYQPHFRQDVAIGRHLVDSSFACVVLLVCAIASRESIDPRVLSDGRDRRTAGWKYFSQTSRLARPLHLPPTVDDVQVCCLLMEFTSTTSNPMASWMIIGLGLRYAVELGFHRHHPNEPRTINSEVSKRLFWLLLFYERATCLYNGRPLSLNEGDYDARLPVQCDEMYWESNGFVQPEGEPCRISGTLYTFRLIPVMSRAIALIHPFESQSLKSGSSQPGVGLATIDSMLNAWFNGIPSSLRWDPSTETTLSGAVRLLLLTYYHLQAMIHRAFINKPCPEAIPSLVICTNAARSCSRLLERIQEKEPTPLFAVNVAAFVSGTVLVANMRKRKQVQGSYVPSGHDLEDLYRCMRTLRDSEIRYDYAVCGEMIRTLQLLAELPVDDPYQRSSSDDLRSFSSPSSGYVLDPILYGLPSRTVVEDQGFPDLGSDIPAQVDMTLFQEVDMWLEDAERGNPGMPMVDPPGYGGMNQYIEGVWPYTVW